MQLEDSNREMTVAWQFIANTDTSVFLTGKAGTGKTTFLKKLRATLPKRMVILAPTGVAAINAGGQTIHSFFQLPFGPFIPGAQSNESNNYFRMAQNKKNLIRSLDLLVIDEISMVRADLLDQIDDALRRYRDPMRPFGGVQLLLIGDLMQLPPVIKNDEWTWLSQYYPTPYFFSSRALQQISYVTLELRHIYRQQNPTFINLLAKVRAGLINDSDIAQLNSRYLPNFSPDENNWIHLTTHNLTAQQHNDSQLSALNGESYTYKCNINGDFPEQNYPTEPQLTIKKGAQVMFIKNDSSAAHAYYNGKIGIVSKADKNSIEVTCPDSSEPIIVSPAIWENNKYTLDPVTKEIKEETVGTFSQFPLRLAWAITIHKSQGLTFDKAIIDINSAFAHGQTYVALSRCRSLQGIILTAPINPHSLITDTKVNSYIDAETQKIEQNINMLPTLRAQYTLTLLNELYSFSDIERDYEWILRIVDEHLSSQYPKFLIRLKAVRSPLHEQLIDIAARFQQQYTSILPQLNGEITQSNLASRICDSCRYFTDKIIEIFDSLITKDAIINIENKQVAKLYNNALSALRQSVTIKRELFNGLQSSVFSSSTYLNIKAKIMLDNIDTAASRKQRKVKQTKEKPIKQKKVSIKTPKINTVEETLRMYNTGMLPDEIASARGLKPSTIYNHLASLISQGQIDMDELVPKEHQIIIRKAAESFTNAYTLKEIRELVPEHISYAEIKIVLS